MSKQLPEAIAGFSHSAQPTPLQGVGHQLHFRRFRKRGVCGRPPVCRRSVGQIAQYRSGWSQLRLEKFPDALGGSSPAGGLRSRSLISADSCPRCSSLRQSKKAPRIIIGVSASPLPLSDKLGVEISINLSELIPLETTS